MATTERNVAVGFVRGPFVRLPAHPESFSEDEEDAFIKWAKAEPGPKAVDLFCGAGGLSLGLHEAGYQVVLGVDHDEEALETHRSLFPGLSVSWDLANDDSIDKVIRLAKLAEAQVIVGGPPCQPFSKAGRSMIRDLVRTGRRHARDDRRDLWESFVAVVEGVRPKAVIMENVPDMALDRDMQILRTMVDLLEGLNYSVAVRVLETSKFEVPQFRQRLVLVALHKRIAFEWPQESGYQVTLRTAIGDLPPVMGGWRPENGADGWAAYGSPQTDFQLKARSHVAAADSRKVFDHITRPVREDDAIIFAAMDSQTSYSQIDQAVAALDRVTEGPAAVREGSFKRYRDDIFDDKYKRLDWNQLSRTITAHIAKDGYWYIHPEQDRTLTVREAARIQTFPDHVRFAGPPSSAFRQIGNAVPPRLGELLGRRVLESLASRERESTQTIALARKLAGWFEVREAEGKLRYPWFSHDLSEPDAVISGRWRVIQAELLLGRARPDFAQTLWPLLSRFVSPSISVERSSEILEVGRWIDRLPHAERVLEAARHFALDTSQLMSVDGMRRAPHVTEGVADLAARVAPSTDEDPVLVTKGVLRVAARFWGTNVDRRNSRSDGRIALARMIGAEDATSDHAFLALIELADSVCMPTRPACVQCPLKASCVTANKR
jgi:DNA (cytosine-5)-methyltransferase 1